MYRLDMKTEREALHFIQKHHKNVANWLRSVKGFERYNGISKENMLQQHDFILDEEKKKVTKLLFEFMDIHDINEIFFDARMLGF